MIDNEAFLGMCYNLCMEPQFFFVLGCFPTNGFWTMVWVCGPWFSNSGFGIGVLEVGKNLILYCKHSI